MSVGTNPPKITRKAQAAHAEKVRAIEAFRHVSVEKYDTQVRIAEQIWIGSFLTSMNKLKTANAVELWLRMVDNNNFPLAVVDRTMQSLRTAIAVDSRPRVINVRTEWEKFVCKAVAEHQWDFTDWPDRIRWLRAIVKFGWDNKDDNPMLGQQLLQYVEWLSKKHLWARDCFLEQRILFLPVAKTSGSMFQGEASTSLPFATAMAGIILRTYMPRPSPEAMALYEQAKVAWPHELAQLESTLQIHAAMDNTTLHATASLAHSMESGPMGYSPYLALYGEQVYPILPRYTNRVPDTIELPVLD